MLKIVKAGEPIPVNQIVVVIYSAPGFGKSTLGYTANEPLLVDTDKGAHRASGRKDTVAAPNWNAIEGMEPNDLAPYKTIVLDTAGRTLDLLTTDIIAKDPKCSSGGGALSLKGFGVLKVRFAAYLNMLKARGKDIVLICHMDEQRSGDDVIERLDVQGGSKGEIYKSADAMGRIIIRNGQRFIDFNPRENSFGKNPCGLPILPFSLDDKTCLADIIRTIKERLNQSSTAVNSSVGRAATSQNKGDSSQVGDPTGPQGSEKARRATDESPAPNGNGHKVFDDGSHVRGVIEKVIARDDKQQWLKAKNGSAYVKVLIGGQTYYAFDNAERVIVNGGEHKLKLFGLLAEAKQNDAIDLVYEVSKKGGRAIKEVTRLGIYEWEPGTGLPVIQRGAQANPEVTNEDVPF